jgi:hypothetical protein
MCYDGTGLRCERTEARLGRVIAETRPKLTPRSGRARVPAPWKTEQSVLASPFRSWSLTTRKHTRRSGSKSDSGRWSHWDDIGWVHYPEIGWSHSDEIRWVRSHEILPKAQAEFSGHLLRGEKALRTQAFKSTLEPRSLA